MMNMSLGTPLLIAIVAAGCAPQSIAPTSLPDVAPGRYVKTLKVDGIDRRYIMKVPGAYDKNKATPVVLMLHGYSGSADRVERTSGIAEAAEAEGWVSVFPDGVGDPKGWNAGFINLTGKKVDDLKFIEAVLDSVERTINTDRKRVFVAGHSNGAMMAHRLASSLSDRIAAIAPVAGIVGITKRSMIGNPENPVSVLMIHGTADPLVAFDAASQAMLRGVPVYEGAQWWAKANGVDDKPTSTQRGAVKTDAWVNGKSGSEVRLVTILQGGHDWPSRAALGTEVGKLIIHFFKSHPKR